MSKSAIDVMQEIIFSAVVDTISTLKDTSKGMPNTLLRDLNAIHANSTFGDLPKEAQQTISAATRAAFNRLRKEGYSVAQESLMRPRRNDSPKRVPNRRGA